MSFPPSFFEHLQDRLELAIYDTNQEIRMAALDRIKSKALQAKQIVPRVLQDVEADLDAIIAEEQEIQKQRQAAMAPHQEAIAELKSELDGVKDALSVLTNGGPPLDPLPVSAPVAPPSNPVVAPVEPTPVVSTAAPVSEPPPVIPPEAIQASKF